MPCYDAEAERLLAEKRAHEGRAVALLCSFLRTGARTAEHDKWLHDHRNRDRDRAVTEAEWQLEKAQRTGHGEAIKIARTALDAIRAADPLTTDLY